MPAHYYGGGGGGSGGSQHTPQQGVYYTSTGEYKGPTGATGALPGGTTPSSLPGSVPVGGGVQKPGTTEPQQTYQPPSEAVLAKPTATQTLGQPPSTIGYATIGGKTISYAPASYSPFTAAPYSEKFQEKAAMLPYSEKFQEKAFKPTTQYNIGGFRASEAFATKTEKAIVEENARIQAEQEAAEQNWLLPAPKPAGGLERAQFKLSQWQEMLGTKIQKEELVGSPAKVAFFRLAGVPLTVASIGGGMAYFGKQLLTKPMTTLKGTATGMYGVGKKVLTGEGFPEVGELLRTRPEVVATEVGTQIAMGEAGIRLFDIAYNEYSIMRLATPAEKAYFRVALKGAKASEKAVSEMYEPIKLSEIQKLQGATVQTGKLFEQYPGMIAVGSSITTGQMPLRYFLPESIRLAPKAGIAEAGITLRGVQPRAPSPNIRVITGLPKDIDIYARTPEQLAGFEKAMKTLNVPEAGLDPHLLGKPSPGYEESFSLVKTPWTAESIKTVPGIKSPEQAFLYQQAQAQMQATTIFENLKWERVTPGKLPEWMEGLGEAKTGWLKSFGGEKEVWVKRYADIAGRTDINPIVETSLTGPNIFTRGFQYFFPQKTMLVREARIAKDITRGPDIMLSLAKGTEKAARQPGINIVGKFLQLRQARKLESVAKQLEATELYQKYSGLPVSPEAEALIEAQEATQASRAFGLQQAGTRNVPSRLLPSLKEEKRSALIGRVPKSIMPSSSAMISKGVSMPSLSFMVSKRPSSTMPSLIPSVKPSVRPSSKVSYAPSRVPSRMPSLIPSITPSKTPSLVPPRTPSPTPSRVPGRTPSPTPSPRPSRVPSLIPPFTPTRKPPFRPSSKEDGDDAFKNLLEPQRRKKDIYTASLVALGLNIRVPKRKVRKGLLTPFGIRPILA